MEGFESYMQAKLGGVGMVEEKIEPPWISSSITSHRYCLALI